MIIKIFIRLAAGTLLITGSAVSTTVEEIGIIPDYIERQDIEKRLQPFGDNILGDVLDVNTGSVHFNTIDVQIPGNFGLSVSMSRKYETGFLFADTDAAIEYGKLPRGPKKYLSDWDIEIPKISWVYPLPLSHPDGKVTPPIESRNFCGTSYTRPASIIVSSDQGAPFLTGEVIPHHDLSNEMDLYIPGTGSQKLLDNPQGLSFPSDTVKVTKDYWIAKCIDANDGARGLLVSSPEGTNYKFDQFFYAPHTAVPITVRINKGALDYDSKVVVPRVNSTLMVSEISDIHGNWIKYEYENSIIKRIYSSDGRAIDFSVEEQKVTQATVNKDTDKQRVWTYKYEENSSGNEYLTTVVRPDNKEWQYDFGSKPIHPVPEHASGDYTCKANDVSITAKHPEGLTGTFTFSERAHKKESHPLTGTSYSCQYLNPQRFEMIDTYDVMSLISKKLDGPGVSNYVWNFEYQEKSEGEANTKWSQSMSPEGVLTRHIFHVGGDLDGLKKEQIVYTEKSGQQVELSSTKYEYKVEQPLGETYLLNQGQTKMVSPRHQSKVSITQSSNQYVTEYGYNSNYDSVEYSFGASTHITEQNDLTSTTGELSITKETLKEYFSDTSLWRLRNPVSTTVKLGGELVKYEYYNSDEDNSDEHNYSGLLKNKSIFGTKQHTYSEYHGDGTIAKVEFNQKMRKADGNASDKDRYVSFLTYKRGIPTSMSLPNRLNDLPNSAMTATRDVDDNGWVSKVTDFNGNSVSYGYDDIGRLVYVDPLSLDEADYFISWSNDEAGNIIRTEFRCELNKDKSDCNNTGYLYSKRTQYDALFRPRLDAYDDGNTTVYVRREFNSRNQVTFESFKSSYETESKGTRNVYDDLGRLSTVTVSGTGTTTYSYLPGNKMAVEDAREHTTTTTYLAHGAPTFEQAVKIESPENVTTDINVNILGNIESITQSGKRGEEDVSLTEYRAYDELNRLCLVNRVDVGATVYKRNSIGEVEWMAQVPNTDLNTTCIADSDVLSSKKVTFSSDNLGALESISYGDNTPTRAYTYDNNGNVKTIGTVDYSQTYNYNSLNLVKDETLVVDGKTLRLDYQYTKLGHLNTITYPEAMGERLPSVNYAANGLGQPTQAVRSYSDSSQETFVQSGASYHPNGIVHTFTYGNGITHVTTLDTNKNIPGQIKDTKSDGVQSVIDVVNLTYDYDNNLNVTSITNTRDLGAYTLNSLTYDDLDRLTATSGGLGIGSSAIQYDGLGNILTYGNDSTYNSSSLTYDYDGNNRLSRVTDTKLPSLNNRDFTQDGYDDRGNVKSNGKRTFVYNLANQMIKSGQSEFLYDGHGRRIRYKKDDGSTEYSMYSHSGQLLYRETSEGYVNYIYFGNRLVSKEGTALTEPASDRDKEENDQSEGSEMNYKPFGESIEPPKDDVGYTGHKFDADLGLSYMQARYYDPVIGRFYSNDPVGAIGHMSRGNSIAHGFNRYAYANNNPYKYTDPDGEFVFLAIAVVGAAITAYDTYQTYQNEGAGAAAQTLAVDGAITLATGGLGKVAHKAYKTLKGSNASSGAESAVQGVNLEKQLASESQLSELAEGGGNVISQPAKQANRIAEQHGVDAANVQKVSSSAHTAKDGSQVQTHAFRDAATNKVIEPKSIIDENN